MIKKISLAILLFPSIALATDYCADSSMKGAWKMEETSSTYTDCTSNGNSGTVSGSVTRTGTGKYGTYAADFTQSNNAYIDFGSGASIDALTSKSVGAWVFADTDGANDGSACSAGVIMGKDDGNDGWFLCFAVTDKIKWRQKWSGGAASWTTTSSVVTYTAYHHMAVTYNASSTSNDPIIYLDGVSQSITENQTPFGTVNSDAAYNLYMGIEGTTLAEFDGRIDEAFLYSGILNSTQINEIMNSALDGTNGGGGGGASRRMVVAE